MNDKEAALRAAIKSLKVCIHGLYEQERILERMLKEGDSITSPHLSEVDRQEMLPIEEKIMLGENIATIKYSTGEKSSAVTRENNPNKGS